MRGKLCGELFVVALVLSCVACGSCITGTILGQTLLQEAPGQGQGVRTTLLPGNEVDVSCRTQDALVYDDPWWLQCTHVLANGSSVPGWVADFYVDCGNVGNCNVMSCP